MGGAGRRHSLPRSSCRTGSAATMRLLLVAMALCCAAAEGALPARARHRKRGALSGLPPFKLGHDIPVVTHSVLKPLVVTYPPSATVAAVKVPLSHPLLPRHLPRRPLPSPHHHHHHHTKTMLLPHSDQHFHHHHHHVAPRPAPPVLPVAQPSGTVVHPLPPPPAPIVPAPVTPLLPAATAPVPVAPLVPFSPQYSYVLRPGNAVQTSYFATYPRYPLASYRPLASPAVLLQQPHAVHIQPHAPPPLLAVAPTPAVLHPAQVEVPQGAVEVHESQPELHAHFAQSAGQLPVAAHALDHDGWAPLGAAHSPFAQEGTQVYEQHGQEYDDQLHQHVQQQLDQAHYEHHQLGHHHEFAAPAPVPAPSAEYGHPGHEYDHHLLQHHHDTSQSQHDHQYAQHEQFPPYEQQFTQHDQQIDQQYAQHDQYLYEQQYGQHVEQHQQRLAASFEGQELQGRSAEEGEQRFHNHIPLGLQPPIDRPLDHFR